MPQFRRRLRMLQDRVAAGVRYAFGRRQPIRLLKLDYDAYWSVRGDHNVMARFPIIARYVHEGETLLDIGCGDGTALAYLVSQAGVIGHGIDISDVAVAMARSKGLSAGVVDIMAADFTLNQTYDTILISEVLEHVADPEAVLASIQSSISTRLILTFPNIAYVPHRVRLLFGRFPVQWGWHPGEHLRFWSLSDFRWWLAQLGYDVEAVKASNGIPLLDSAWPNLFGNQIIVIARPASTRQ